ncbi:MAG: glycosyltransferase, partial [Nanoarchaeota archaeon]
MMKLSIIIPTYNEAENIKELISEIGKVCKKDMLSYNIIIVDDNSPDNTSKIVKDVMQEDKHVTLIEREGKMGLGTAYIKGIKYSLNNLHPDLIMTMDADFSHNPKYIPDFMNKIKYGFDVVLGSRYVPGGGIGKWGIHRTIISKGANYLAKTLLGLVTKDNTTGYRIYKREVLERIDLNSIKSNGYSFLMEMVFLCQYHNFKIAETPIFFDIRRHGASKISKKEIFKALKTILGLKFRIKPVNYYVAKRRIGLAVKFLRKDENILDVGCGDMYITNKLTKMGFNITGVDINPPFHIKMDATNMKFDDNS